MCLSGGGGRKGSEILSSSWDDAGGRGPALDLPFSLLETKKRPPQPRAHPSPQPSSAGAALFCFVEKELKAQSGAMTFPGSHSQHISELTLNSDPLTPVFFLLPSRPWGEILGLQNMATALKS